MDESGDRRIERSKLLVPIGVPAIFVMAKSRGAAALAGWLKKEDLGKEEPAFCSSMAPSPQAWSSVMTALT